MATDSSGEHYGLFRLHPAKYVSDQCYVDIVAIHGLNGHAFKTWTNKSGHLWLRDSLPSYIPDARIMTFGYDSGVVFNQSEMQLGDFASELLIRLQLVRQKDTEKKRPLVFLCHSLGGLLVKEALIQASLKPDEYADIMDSASGIAFFGTPHRGSRTASPALILAKILNIMTFGIIIRSELLRTLELSSQEIETLSRHSNPIISRLPVVSFYEQKTIGGRLIVEPFSAILGLPNERAIPVNRDHRSMVHMSPEKKQEYLPVWTSIKRLVERSRIVSEIGLDSLIDALFCFDYKTAQLRPSLPHPETCKWLLQHPTLRAWTYSPGSAMILLSGPAGCGKSVLTRFIVEEVLTGREIFPNDSARGHAITFFCSYNDQAFASEVIILRSLLHQLLQLEPKAESIIRNRLEKRKRHIRTFDLDPEKLWAAITDVLSMQSMEKVFIGIDAIEELKPADASKIISGFHKVVNQLNNGSLGRKHQVRIFFSSRPNARYQSEFPSMKILQVSRSDLNGDIRCYLRDKIRTFASTDEGFQSAINSKGEDVIIEKITNRADGMFLWAVIAWDDFQRGGLFWNGEIIDQKLEALGSMPSGINPLYEKMISRVEGEYRKDMWKMFSIIAVVERPLHELELGIVLAVSKLTKGTLHNLDQVEPIANLANYAQNHFSELLTPQDDGSITFAHLSAKDYVLQRWEVDDPSMIEKARQTLTQTCLSYLKFYDPNNKKSSHAGTGAAAGFASYATHFYIDHLVTLKMNDPLWDMLRETASSSYFQGADNSPLHSLIGRCCGSTKSIGEVKCHEIIRQLVAKGYDLNDAGNTNKRGAILAYCCHNFVHFPVYKPTVLLLLELGANPNIFPEQYSPPFKYIILSGDKTVHEAFINHPGFDFDSQDVNGKKPIHHVVELGSDDFILTLLDKAEVDINAQDSFGQTALHMAVVLNKSAVVKRLLSMFGIRIDLMDEKGRTPLALATYWGLKKIALDLISRSEAFPLPDEENMNALIMAARHGDEEVANALLGKTKYRHLNRLMDESGKTLLHHSAINDWDQILDHCLSTGKDINVNQIDHSGGTALHYAAKLGCTRSCEVLLRFGASTRLQDRNGRNAAQVAADSGFKDTLVALLNSGTLDVNQRDHQGRNLIHWAATLDFLNVMRRLCELPNAEFDINDHHGKSPLDYAYICQCRAVGLYLSNRMKNKMWPTPWMDFYDWVGLYNKPKPPLMAADYISREDRDAFHTNTNNEEWAKVAREYPAAKWAIVAFTRVPPGPVHAEDELKRPKIVTNQERARDKDPAQDTSPYVNETYPSPANEFFDLTENQEGTEEVPERRKSERHKSSRTHRSRTSKHSGSKGTKDTRETKGTKDSRETRETRENKASKSSKSRNK